MALDHAWLSRPLAPTVMRPLVSKAAMKLLPLVLLALTAAIAAQSSTQTTADTTTPAFAVASIKQSPPPGTGPMFFASGPRPGGQWLSQNATVITLMRSSYPNFRMPGQIVGGPAWINTDRFDINARAEGNPSNDVMNAMLRRLLADRFSLKVHTEQREVDAYALVLARADGRLGPGLKKPAVDCEAREEARKKAAAAGAPPAAPPVPPAPPALPKPGERPECGMLTMMTNGVQRLATGGTPVTAVATAVQQTVGRPVIDRTGLTGRWDIDLEFAGTGPLTTADTPDAPASVFTAVQEQLGLKLESRKETMEVLVIDSVERPTEN